MEERKRTHWIWLKEWSAQDKEEPALVLFRKELYLAEMAKAAHIQISADSRYKLYINGKLVEMGPSRGDRQIWYYDEVDILPYLTEGENVLAVQVLRYPTQHQKGNHGIFRTETPGLYVEGLVTDQSGNVFGLDADESWKAKKDAGFHIVSESEYFAPLQILENRWGSAELNGWMTAGYDDTGWSKVWEYPDMSRAVSPGNLQPRTIPFLYRKERTFAGVTAVRRSAFSKEGWEAFLKGNSPLTIPACQKEIVEISAGEEMTGYLSLRMQGGKGASLSILTSEGYVQDAGQGHLPRKGKRTDWENGYLHGFTDHYRVAGYGAQGKEEQYTPFWFRTFRYIRLEIETAQEPLTLTGFSYTETGYPLQIRAQVQTSDESLKGIWEISERTLRRCMHETYEDCPFYEQLQYAMDSRSQILYTYAAAADDRLARKCMDDFRRSQRYDGLLNCSYPCYGPNVIPGFSIYYILMLYDHMMYFGDKELLEDHMPTVERILHYFHRNLQEDGYVRKTGGLNGRDRFWSFIDWTPEWNATTGVPSATLKGAITMESLLYILGLLHAAKLAEYMERQEQAKAYESRAKKVQQALLGHCMGKKGMLTDGPGVEEYSQHVQVFAVLTGTVDREAGRRNLEETILHKENYAQCSVAMAFYLFRALEKTGLYAYTDEYWNIWRNMLEKEVTTCVEDAVGERSDCHAWGSLILYELPAIVLGVRPAKPGYEAVAIRPQPGYLTWAQGCVPTPKGDIRVRWKKEESLHIEYEVPEGLQVLDASMADVSSGKKPESSPSAGGTHL